jgi:superfamily I DNA/RNA helicase
LAIARKHGMEKLAAVPQITVGTIHSVKGATFDVVYLFPDLSPQAMEDWWRDRDSILRCWYVGATRSRETLIICSPGSPYSISGV